MPDQSSAADEHALMQEITAPLTTLPDDPMQVVTNVDFPVVLRGYDRLAVDAYVQKTSQLVAELQATRSPEAAVRRAIERVGEQISGILTRAHQTAGEITTQSRREAEDRLEVARQEAAGIMSAAEARVRELDSDTDRIWVERQRIIDDVQALSRELQTVAQSAGERFPPAEAAEPPPAVTDPESGAAEPPPALQFESTLDTEPPAEPDPTAGHEASSDPVEPEASGVYNDEAAEPGHEATEVSDIEATAVMPALEDLDVDPPSLPSFRDEDEKPT